MPLSIIGTSPIYCVMQGSVFDKDFDFIIPSINFKCKISFNKAALIHKMKGGSCVNFPDIGNYSDFISFKDKEDLRNFGINI